MQLKKIIEDKIKELTANKVVNPIVTEVKPVMFLCRGLPPRLC
jgi:hypothetical protein